MNNTAIQPHDHPELASESLTAAQWARLLGVEVRTFRKRRIADCGQTLVGTTTARAYRRADLPSDYETRIQERLTDYGLISAVDLHGAMTKRSPSWTPAKKFSEHPPATQEKALKVRDALTIYFQTLDTGASARDAERACQRRWRELFNRSCSDRTIRNWVARVNERGGIENAPNEAFCDGKSIAHPSTRLLNKIPRELIEEFRSRCVKPGTEHISAAVRSLEVDWMMGRDVPGLGHAERKGEPFPYKYHQLRKFAPSTPARRLGSHGNARARRECLPYVVATTAALKRGQMYLLDDTRIDLIVLDDLTGRPIELKSYWMIDLATRRIEGWLIRESGKIRATDVTALVARVLRSCGVAPLNAGFATTVKFERGTVACSPAQQSFLEGAFPGRLIVSRTSMDGGRNFAGDYHQDRSGHWMGKGHVEALMRTLAYHFQHMPGQRGGDYRRQPAHLGLKGRNRETGALDYNKRSQIHEGALTAYAGRAIEYIEDGLDSRLSAHADRTIERVGERLRCTAMLTASQAMDCMREMVAYLNMRTAHRMEGFQRIDFIQPDGRPGHRMESPDERAARLEAAQPLERLSAADAAQLVRTTCKTVTVRPNGVTMDIAPYKGLRFWREDSRTCQEASLLATSQKQFIAAYDVEQLLHSPSPEIYLLRGTGPNWRPGDPAQFVESLPLCHAADRTDPEDMANQLAAAKRVQQRYERELVTAAAPAIAERLAAARDNTSRLREVVTTTIRTGPIAESNSPWHRRPAGDPNHPPQAEDSPTRADQQTGALPGYTERLAEAYAQDTHE